jgi:hypothetical protein
MEISDAGQRVSDIINNVRASRDWDEIKHGWMAFQLEDGTSDRIVYDTKSDAIRHHMNKAQKYYYVSLRECMAGCTPKEATAFLALVRAQSEQGRYHPEIQDNIKPLLAEDFEAELASTKSGINWVNPHLAARLHII